MRISLIIPLSLVGYQRTGIIDVNQSGTGHFPMEMVLGSDGDIGENEMFCRPSICVKNQELIMINLNQNPQTHRQVRV